MGHIGVYLLAALYIVYVYDKQGFNVYIEKLIYLTIDTSVDILYTCAYTCFVHCRPISIDIPCLVNIR